MSKEKLSCFINLFSRLSTIIFLFSGIYVYIFWKNSVVLGSSYIFAVLAMSFLFTAVWFIIQIFDGLSKKMMIIMQTGYFIFVNTVVIAIGRFLQWFDMSDKRTIIGMEIMFISVYFIFKVLFYFIDLNTAAKMNEKLRERSKRTDSL